MICKNMASKRVKNLLKSAVCANDASNEYNKCNINYIDLLLDVENSKDSKQKLIHVCCGYVEVFQCVRAKATSFPSCGPDEIEANVNFIRGFFDNANSLICGEYSADSDQCEKVRIIRKPNRHPSKRPESYFNPLVKVISNL
ncbi:hypothetical protein RDWZM_009067 [Blomia tropicalis]|uniref:Uncharacterized protein n=1 Tax=Blomia tropicalis TaxID=40697 RepID=A0A9Q0M5V1_BLOTA|nr:hypothetical protein RDWZM_009067 [Blomia tropicalis]